MITAFSEVPRVDYEKLSGDRLAQPSESIRKRVQAARDIQAARFGIQSLPTLGNRSQETSDSMICNADMRVAEIRKYCQLKPEGQALMRSAMSQMQLSARAYHRISELARRLLT